MKILLCDLQFSNHGSFIDDYNSIKGVLDNDHEIVYYTDNIKSISSIKCIFKFIFYCKKNKYDRIVILSTKLTLLPILLLFIKKIFFVYHFTPNSREKTHSYLLNYIIKRCKIGVYSYGIYYKLFKEYRQNIFYIPSRILNLDNIATNYLQKINSNSVNVFIPYIKTGVRKFFDFNKVFESISKYYKIDNVYIQNVEIISIISDKYNTKQLSDYMSISDYQYIFSKSTFILLEFDDLYELRASGIILDSIANAAVVVTTNHEINFQYGFPNFPVISCDSIDELKLLNENLIYNNLINTKIIFENEFKISWENFIK